jgi:hypothetical protein
MIWQAFLLRLTWVTIKRQTDAAARSAKAFINKERSRLFVNGEITDDFVATFHAVNRGLSPARITYKFVGCELFETEEKFAEKPPVYWWDSEVDYESDEWLIPGKPHEIGQYDASYISPVDNSELYENIMSRKNFAWFYGIVRYVDSVSEDGHEIRFCYKCWPRREGGHRLHAGGPATYISEI